MPETSYDDIRYRLHELDHAYGDRVHIVAEPYLLTLLEKLCSPNTGQPEVARLVEHCYRALLVPVVNQELPRVTVTRDTRMIDSSPRGRYHGEILDPGTRVVTVSIARAGALPSEICYRYMNELLDPARQRQDFLMLERVTDSERRVRGAEVLGAKIGGGVDGAVLLVPDPMGATGSSVLRALSHYRECVEGTPARILLVHLIVTPEYIRKVLDVVPLARIYAARLDRGLSDDDVLASRLGTLWERERGLDDHQYIVPGAGGMGELLNNSYN